MTAAPSELEQLQLELDRSGELLTRVATVVAQAQGQALGLWLRLVPGELLELLHDGLELLEEEQEQQLGRGVDVESYGPGERFERVQQLLELLHRELAGRGRP